MRFFRRAHRSRRMSLSLARDIHLLKTELFDLKKCVEDAKKSRGQRIGEVITVIIGVGALAFTAIFA